MYISSTIFIELTRSFFCTTSIASYLFDYYNVIYILHADKQDIGSLLRKYVQKNCPDNRPVVDKFRHRLSGIWIWFRFDFHFRLNFIVYPDFKIQVHKMTQKVCEHFNKLINMNDPSYFNCSYSYSLLWNYKF